MFSSGDQTSRGPKEDFSENSLRRMGSVIFHCQSPLGLSSFSALSKTKLRRQCSPRKEIADGSLPPKDLVHPCVLSIQADGDGRSISSKRRISALGRIPKDDGNKAQQSSGANAKSPKNPEEIICLLRRIRSSIAKESASLKERSSKSSDEKASGESVLEVLRQSRTPGKTARKERNNTSTRQRDSSRKELKAEFSSPLARPPSKFVRRSPVPSSNQKELVKLKSLSLPPTCDENRNQFPELKDVALHEIEKMKLPELKELAKSKGIKGYSRLKKAELIKLLSTSKNCK